jgi:site-specific DNA-methyltransferase (adenine-specific)
MSTSQTSARGGEARADTGGPALGGAGLPTPYYDGGDVVLYLGDCREVIPALELTADLVVADPPYGETSLAWDRWPDGWPALAATIASSMWCFGSMRMFLDRRDEFAAWRLSQDVVWEKQSGTGATADRFRRVHEHALHWYRGPWRDVHHEVPRVPAPPEKIGRNGTVARRTNPTHRGTYGTAKVWTETGTRLMPSVMRVRNMHRNGAVHPSEKPVGLLTPLIEYACPPDGIVLDPFAGSGSTLDAARQTGRRAIGIEAHEPYAEKAARRLEQLTLEAT